MPRLGRRFAQCRDSGDDAEPGVSAIGVALLAHRLDHLARLSQRGVSMGLNPEMRLGRQLRPFVLRTGLFFLPASSVSWERMPPSDLDIHRSAPYTKGSEQAMDGTARLIGR